jgi:hypothetical protein
MSLTETLTSSDDDDDSESQETFNTKAGGGIALLHQTPEQFTSATSNHDLLLSWLADDGVNLTNVSSASRSPETRLQHHWLPDELWPDQSLTPPYNDIDQLDVEDATPVLLKVLGLQWSAGATHAGRQSLRNELLTRLQVGLCVSLILFL